MDLVAEQLIREGHQLEGWELTECLPPYRRRLSWLGSQGRTFDRAWNRYVRYPRYARRLSSRGGYDFYHIVDHSYAHLVHALPAERTGVYCHDLDAFWCLLKPREHPRGVVLRRLMRQVLTGLQKAALVFTNSQQTTGQLLEYRLVDPSRILLAPLGISAEFQPSDPEEPPEPLTLLHVGSCIPRKRIDVLLRVVAELRRDFPSLRLIKVGGEWSHEHRQFIEALHLGSQVQHLHNLSRAELAKHYQRASVVLVPSEAEGFGLPVIEALACGAVVVASDIPALREAGGAAALYCPVGDVSAWVDVVRQLWKNITEPPDRPTRLTQARRFSWHQTAKTILDAYTGRLGPTPSPRG